MFRLYNHFKMPYRHAFFCSACGQNKKKPDSSIHANQHRWTNLTWQLLYSDSQHLNLSARLNSACIWLDAVSVWSKLFTQLLKKKLIEQSTSVDLVGVWQGHLKFWILLTINQHTFVLFIVAFRLLILFLFFVAFAKMNKHLGKRTLLHSKQSHSWT